MTKELRIVVVVIVTLAMVLTVALTGNVQAKKHHQDIPCTFSHKNDECFGHDTSNFPKPRYTFFAEIQCECTIMTYSNINFNCCFLNAVNCFTYRVIKFRVVTIIGHLN